MKKKKDEKEQEVTENKETINAQEEAQIAEESQDELESETDKVSELETKCQTLHNDYLRLYAEFDNYRKRTLKIGRAHV